MIYNSRVGTKYITDSQDIWDIVALRAYGDERAMHTVIGANLKYLYQDAFPADVELNIPATATVAVNFRPTTQIPNIRQLLPWR